MALHELSGSGAPSFTPTGINQHYTDIVSGNLYFSKGTSSSADWVLMSSGSSGVASFNTRTGAVTPQAGDYTYTDVGADASGAAATVQGNLTTHIGNVANPHAVTKTQVGLSNVDNTSDATKNSAVATLTNKTLTSPVINSPTGITKSDVGLSNVDNTSDLNKPISTATQTALNAKVTANTSITGATNTKITYDSKGLVTAGTQAALTDLSDTSIVTPILNDYLKYNGSQWVNSQITTQTNAAQGVNYFLTATASGIGAYDLMSKTPDTVAEVDETVIVNNNTQLIEGYISDVELNDTTIDPGVWHFNMFSYVSATGGDTRLIIDVYKRTSGGTETLLFTATSDTINATSVQLYTIETVQPAFTTNATDKLIFKISASTTATTNKTVHLVHSGTAHYSYAATPLVVHHNDLSDLQGGTTNQYYHLTNSEYTGTGSGVFVRSSSPNITTPTGIVKADVGLSNVDNTSDLNKPISTATQTALNLKQNILYDPTRTIQWNSTSYATLQAAINAAEALSQSDVTDSLGVTILLPNHDFTAESVVIKKHVHLVGMNKESTLLGTVTYRPTSSTVGPDLVSIVNCSINHLNAYSETATSSGIFFTSFFQTGLYVDNCKIIIDGELNRLQNCYISNCELGSSILITRLSDLVFFIQCNGGQIDHHTNDAASNLPISYLNGAVQFNNSYILQVTLTKDAGTIPAYIISNDTHFNTLSGTNNIQKYIVGGGIQNDNISGTGLTTLFYQAYAPYTPAVSGSWSGQNSVHTALDYLVSRQTNINNTSDANKPVSTATQTALNLKANLASPALTGVPTAPTASNGTNTTQIATTAFVLANAGSAADATTISKGIVQLAGDLSGTAASPTVPGLAGKEPTIAAGTTAQYYRGDKTFQTLNSTAVGLGNVDNTSDATKNAAAVTLTNKTIAAATISGKLTTNFDGDQRVMSQDGSKSREFVWSTAASGALYTLVGQFVMWGISHNVALDSSGNFLGRDDTDACELFLITETGESRWYYAPSNTAGTVPVFTLGSSVTSAGVQSGIFGDVTGSLAASVVSKLQGRTVASTAPTSGQLLAWNSGSSQWEPTTSAAGSTGFTVNTTANSQLTLTSSSSNSQLFIGSTPGQSVVLPNATTLVAGNKFDFANKSSVLIPIYTNGGALLAILYPESDLELIVTDISTSAGTWYKENGVYITAERVALFDDFISSGITSGTIGELPWTLVAAGGHTVSYATSTTTEQGVIVLGPGTGINAGGGLHLGNTAMVVGGGAQVMEWRVRFPTLSTSTQEYEAYCGLSNTLTVTAEITNGVYFAYQRASNVNWTLKTAATTRIAVAANTWYKLTLVINAAGTQVDGYINGVFVGTSITTTIPTAAMSPAILSQKTVGATDIPYQVDYAYYTKNWTTLR
jgi:hypothetical protein